MDNAELAARLRDMVADGRVDAADIDAVQEFTSKILGTDETPGDLTPERRRELLAYELSHVSAEDVTELLDQQYAGYVETQGRPPTRMALSTEVLIVLGEDRLRRWATEHDVVIERDPR